jgi:hypothetical protein
LKQKNFLKKETKKRRRNQFLVKKKSKKKHGKKTKAKKKNPAATVNIPRVLEYSITRNVAAGYFLKHVLFSIVKQL